MKCLDDCGRDLDRHRARGLCPSCYGKRHRAGTHIDLPRRTWPRDEVLTEWQLLHPLGFTRRQVAKRLGMSLKAFERACTRARTASRTHSDNQSACL